MSGMNENQGKAQCLTNLGCPKFAGAFKCKAEVQHSTNCLSRAEQPIPFQDG